MQNIPNWRYIPNLTLMGPVLHSSNTKTVDKLAGEEKLTTQN